MMRDRPNGEAGNLAAAAGGVLLFVSLFLDWYTRPGYTVTAWTAFEVWDVVLALIAVAVMLSAAGHFGWWRGPVHGLRPLILGFAGLLIVASQLIDRPPAVLHSGIGAGGWLALVGTALMAVGALIAESRVTVSFNAASPTAVDPEVRRSAPAWRRSRAPAPAGGTGAVAHPAGPAPVPSVGGQPRAGDRVIPPTPVEDETTIATPTPPRRPRGA